MRNDHDLILTLFHAVCRLANTVSILGDSPRAPFESRDAEELLQLAADLAQEAKRLRDPGSEFFDVNTVTAAQSSVNRAQSSFESSFESAFESAFEPAAGEVSLQSSSPEFRQHLFVALLAALTELRGI